MDFENGPKSTASPIEVGSDESEIQPPLPLADPVSAHHESAHQETLPDLIGSPFPLIAFNRSGLGQSNPAAMTLLGLASRAIDFRAFRSLFLDNLVGCPEPERDSTRAHPKTSRKFQANLLKSGARVHLESAWSAEGRHLFFSLFPMEPPRETTTPALPEWQQAVSQLFSQDPAVVLDPQNGHILDANAAFCESLGYSNEMLRTLPWIQLELVPEGRGGLISEIKSWPLGEVRKYEVILRDREGRSRNFEARAQLIGKPNQPFFIWTGIESTHLVSRNQELRDREMVFSTIIGQALDGVALIDLSTGKFSAFNEAAHRDLGYDQTEFSRMSLEDLVAPEGEIVTGPMKAPGVSESVQKRKDGTLRYVRISNRKTSMGGKDFLVSIWTDISERKWAENAIRESETRFAAAFDQALIGMALVSQSGKFLRVNPALETILGYSEKELLEKDFQAVTHAEDIGEELQALGEMIQGFRDAHRRIKRFLNKTGNVVWVDLLVRAIRPARGSQVFFITQVMDLTDLKRSRDLLGQSERRFLNAFDFAATGQALISLDGQWIKVNPAMCEMLGYEEADLLGSNVDQHGTPKEGGITLDLLQGLLKGETKSAKYLKKYRHKQGHTLWISESVSLLRNDEGDPLHFVGQLVDMTLQMETMDALRKSEERERTKRGELETLFELTPTPLWVAHEPECLRITGNRAAYELFQQPFGANLAFSETPSDSPAPYTFIRNGKPLPREDHPLRKVLKTGLRWEFGELELRFAVGEPKFIWGRAEPLFRPDGTITGAIVAVVDITELKRSESALRESEERWKFALEGSEEGVWDWNIKTGETHYSRRWKEMLGYQDSEISNEFEEWSSRVFPEDLPKVLQAKRDYFDGKTMHFSNEHRMLTKQGEWQWRLTRGKVVSWDELGKPVRMIGTHVDITKRKLAEFQQEFHGRIMAKIATGAPLHEVLTLIVSYVERQFPNMICSIKVLDPVENRLYSGAGQGLPESFRNSVHGLKIGPQVISSGAAAYWGKRVVAADVYTHPNWVEWVEIARENDIRSCWSEPILGIEKQVLGTMSLYHRTVHHPTPTEMEVIQSCVQLAGVAMQKKRAEDLLATNQRLLSEAEHLSVTGGWMWEEKRNLCVGSSGWQKLMGTDQRELAGVPHSPFCLSEDQPLLEEAWQKLLAGQGPLELEHRIRRQSDGEIRWIAMRGVLVRHPSQPDLVFGAAQDITQRKQSQEALALREKELTRSNADLQQFSYAASHDLQEPLRMISNFTQLLAKRYGKDWDEKGQRYFFFVQDGCSRMKRLIDDLLEYARVGMKHSPTEEVNIEQLVDECLVGMGALILENEVKVERGPLPRVTGHRALLTQLFSNLIGNSIKFRGKARPIIGLTCQNDGDSWKFSLEDNGIGIPPEFRERVFALFQRLHTRDEYPGTGIGLALCKKIVERHGGKIGLENPSLGTGTRVVFTLPKRRNHEELIGIDHHSA